MIRFSACVVAFALAACAAAAAVAQTTGITPSPPAGAQPAPAPRRQGPPPIVSPEVHADRTVVFRLRAPGADRVTVSGEWPGGEKAMTKDDQGVWSVTVGPLEPDLYGYGFSVDGFRTLDPSNSAVKPMRSPTTSILEIPGAPALPHEFTDVPHGTVRVHAYRSKSLDKKRGLYVYTPPDYERNGSQRYPVLYLFHGSGDNEATWTALGRANLILDNLIAAGKARPMLIVMTDGHAAPAQPAAAAAGTPDSRSRNVEAFGRDLLEDVIPFVEANYRAQTNPQGRAIVGLSMGGGQSLTIGLTHPNLFAYVGGFSSSVREPEKTIGSALADPKATNQKFKLIWIGCGKDDFLIQANRDFSELLKQRGIKHELVVSEGNHSWPVWRRYLVQFAPLLFQGK
jgi:enterochelin esterase family protein